MPAPARRACIYVRKSSEEGLEQAFNSLDAQREACAAYIGAHRHEGWTLLDTAYEDGGYSGGSLERPGIQKLLADAQAGKLDIVVVYKIDRLTRSLADFARLVEIFDRHRISFVAVTQQFNTTTSMGRLTLNVLLSFAQFEREVTGERIRDKIAASKKKGMWMGGLVPLGYEAQGRTLVVNPAEADTVRTLFGLYRKLRSVDALAEEAARRGIVSKSRTRGGVLQPGTRLARGAIYTILGNPIYVGAIAHKGARYPGQHAGIVDRVLFDEVQAILADNRRRGTLGRGAGEHISLLAGLLVDERGSRLMATHTVKGPRRYRYYALANGGGRQAMRLAAHEIEALVVDGLVQWLRDDVRIHDVLSAAGLQAGLAEALTNCRSLADQLKVAGGAERRALLLQTLQQVRVEAEALTLRLNVPAVLRSHAGATPLAIVLPLRRRMQKRGNVSLVFAAQAAEVRRPDPALIGVVARGRAWYEALATGSSPSLVALAKVHGVSRGYVGHLVDLAFLAPDLVAAIVEGRHPAGLSAERLKRICPLPVGWEAQRKLFNRLAAFPSEVLLEQD